MNLILTCEHASNHVPTKYKALFADAGSVLQSHRGWDPGSLSLARSMERELAAPIFQTNFTRLLVEPNRSLGHPGLFSEFTKQLDAEARQKLISEFYFPHRNSVESWIRSKAEKRNPVLHLSVHTFVPVLDGVTRTADVGLLYDPQRKAEKSFCRKWQLAIAGIRPDLKVRRNYPYLGSADGFTTYLRKMFPADQYLGIELEVNQAISTDSKKLKKLATNLAHALNIVIQGSEEK